MAKYSLSGLLFMYAALATAGSTMAAPDVTPYFHTPTLVGAAGLHEQGILGDGITVAVLDTGSLPPGQLEAADLRVIDEYDLLPDTSPPFDGSGHGTHIASVIGSGLRDEEGHYLGVAPHANLLLVRAFDENGVGRLPDVVDGIYWVIENKDRYNIRVLNLSFSGRVQSAYWKDPIDIAVMQAWAEGIVVVASAGNRGPDPLSIGVPGNTPYAITVGATMNGDGAPDSIADDLIAPFSSVGPTQEGFLKPEVVAPGAAVLGLVQPAQAVPAVQDAEQWLGHFFIDRDGVSFSTAVVSGVAALLLSADPGLTPDEVKCRLMSGAHPALSTETDPPYFALLQQGAGMVDATTALEPAAGTGCPQGGLDVTADLAGDEHFIGPAMRDADGNLVVTLPDGTVLSGTELWADGFIWSDTSVFEDGVIWSNTSIFSDGVRPGQLVIIDGNPDWPNTKLVVY